MGLLISTETLSNTSLAIVLDCRFHLSDLAEGKKDFDAGHIPGAQHADLDQHLAAAPGDYGWHPLPEKEALADPFQHWGINPETRIVCYNQNNGAFAAGLWWLCRWLGHDDVFALDGGLDGLIHQGLSVSNLQETFTRGHFTPKATLTNICQFADLLVSSNTLLEALDSARYRSDVEPIDAVAGHIPHAIPAPFSDNMSEGYFKPKAVLKQRFETLDLTPDSPLVCYCGSGVTAINNVRALLIAGYPEPALYPSSWSEWITDSNRPIETA
jgi:thiosulfate/3-mercaptopyruvate sulfurtransferase